MCAGPASCQWTPLGRAVSGRDWGITKAQLRELYRASKASSQWDADHTIRDFVEKFVKPRTKGTGMGLALTLNAAQPQAVTLMVSHAWDENAGRFFDDLEAHVKEHEVVFLCFLALYQCEDGAGPSISQQLGSDIHAGPFFEVIESLQPARTFGSARGRMLVMTNEECALYTRLWCIWEAYVAATRGVPVEYTRRGRLFADATASSRTARCGDPRDESLIRDAIVRIPVETRWSRFGAGFGIGLVVAAVAVPAGFFATFTVGLSIGGFVVKCVSYVLDVVESLLPPKARLVSRIISRVTQITGTGLLLGSAFWAVISVLFLLLCWCFVSRRRVRATGRLGARVAGGDGYTRLDAVVRRNAKEY